MPAEGFDSGVRLIGRYALHGEIASGGMATVHLGRLRGPVGFSRTVAIKRLHAQFAKDPEFVAMFLDEARLAARIRHPNVVSTIDVVATKGELFLVMEYISGESLSRLARETHLANARIPPRVSMAIMTGVLQGLHAAHEATSESGEPLHIVHRDVSPQNVFVGTDGIARVLDFGVAKAAGRLQSTRDGMLKGKLCYMAPEQFEGRVTRQTDVYAAAIVLWEILVGRRLFAGDSEAVTLYNLLAAPVEPPSVHLLDAGLSDAALRAIDRVTRRGLERDPKGRYATAREMALELEQCIGLASASEVGAWVEASAGEALTRRSEKIAEVEKLPSEDAPLSSEGLKLAGQLLDAARHEERTSVSELASSRPATVGEEGPDTTVDPHPVQLLQAPGPTARAAPPGWRRTATWALAATCVAALAGAAAGVALRRPAPQASVVEPRAAVPSAPASAPAAGAFAGGGGSSPSPTPSATAEPATETAPNAIGTAGATRSAPGKRPRATSPPPTASSTPTSRIPIYL